MSSAMPTNATTHQSLSAAIDQHVASQDVIERICLVPTVSAALTNDSGALNEASGNFVATHKLWPALKFDSLEQLTEKVKSDVPTSELNKLKATLILTYRRVLKEARASAALYPNSAEGGVAYLLGRGNIQRSLVLLNGDNVFDFYDHFCEMEEAQGYCGTKEFKHAYAMAMSRLEGNVEGNVGEPLLNAASAQSASAEADVDANANVVVKKPSAGVSKLPQPPSNPAPRKTFDTVEYPGDSSSNQSPLSALVKKAKSTKQTKKTKSLDESDEVPVETCEMSDIKGDGSISSLEEPTVEQCNASEPESEPDLSPVKKIRPRSPALSPTLPWKRLWPQMKTQGWTHIPGDNLISYYFVNSTCRGMNKMDILKNRKKGEDYFESEEEVKRYACKNLGWKGEVESPVSLSDLDMTDRIRIRRQAAVKPDTTEDKTEPSQSKQSKSKPSFKSKNEVKNTSLKSADSNKEEAADEDLASTPRRNKPRSSPAKSPAMPWGEMWKQMRSQGWTYMLGTGLVAYYWIHPTCAHMKKADLLEKTEGEDYFTSEEAVRRYACKHLGWKGDVESSPQSLSDEDMGDRVKKRKRNETVKHNTEAEAKKSSNKIESKGKKHEGVPKVVKAKKVAESTPSTVASSSPGEGSSSESSRFSQVDSPSQDGSDDVETKNTPTRQLSFGKQLSFGGASKRGKQKSTRKLKEAKKTTSPDDVTATPSSTDSGVTENSDSASDDFSEQSSIDGSYQVMSTKDAWDLLREKFKFTLDSGKYYCLPGEENRPGKNPVAVEGTNYFKSLEDLRNNLCAYGLPECRFELSLDEKIDINRWVRYAHVVGLTDAARINPAQLGEPINVRTAWGWLKTNLGMKYSCGSYIIPSSDPSTSAKKFDRQQDFLAHISRFGIPLLNVKPADALSTNDRMRLDLFLTEPSWDLVNTFNRIKPSEDYTTAITPRRTRNERENTNKSTMITDENAQVVPSGVHLKRGNKHRTYQLHSKQHVITREFNGKEIISTEEAVRLVTTHYNFSKITSDGVLYYCLPGVDPGGDFVLGCDFFSHIQDMRRNLCAYGMPAIAKGSKMSDTEKSSLELWIRCANIGALQQEPAQVPECFEMKTIEVWNILKRFGYQLSKDEGTYYLPGTMFHKSRLGEDRFGNITELFKHIARFGLSSVEQPNAEDPVPQQEKLKLQLFVSSVANYDVWKRVKCDTPIMSAARKENLETASAAAATTEQSQDQVGASTAAIKPKFAAETQPAVVVDECDLDSPLPSSPPKKARTGGLLGWMSSKVSPLKSTKAKRSDSDASSADQSVHTSNSFSLSPSCLEKGDEEVEACFAGAVSTPPKNGQQSDTYLVKPDDVKPSSPLRRSPRLVNEEGNSATENEPMKAQESPQKRQLESEITVEGASPKKVRASPKADRSEVPGTPIKNDITKPLESKCDGKSLCMADKEPTVRGKLEQCLIALHPAYKGKQPLAKSGPRCSVSLMEDEIKDFMMKSIVTGTDIDGMTSPSPGFMYICGGPGTGKTTTVTACSNIMKKWAKQNNHQKPVFCFINMAGGHTSLSTKEGLMRGMLNKIAAALDIEKGANLCVFEKAFKKKVVVLVLDEIDMLFKKHDGVGGQWFKTLVAMAEEKDLRFSMIGISNCVNDSDANIIREFGNSPHELVFPAYKEEDIEAILRHRVGRTIIDPKALQLIARKVATSSGDARRALEITSHAVSQCIESLSETKLDMEVQDNECMPLVKIPNMMRAVRAMMATKHTDIIRGLPQAAKVVLCIAVSLSQVWGPTAEISVSMLKNYCIQATHHSVMDEMNIGHVLNLVEMLVDSGLLVTGNNGHFDVHDNAKLKIGVQLDDVENALEESLLKEGGFYRQLMDYVRKECPNPR